MTIAASILQKNNLSIILMLQSTVLHCNRNIRNYGIMSHNGTGSEINSRRQDASANVLQESYGILQTKPKHPEFVIKSKRESSFENFPVYVTQTAKELSEAGFFYSGKGDIVICYHCDQGLKSWEPDDDVWIEHARWSPKCVHLQNCKGREFVQMITDTLQMSNTSNQDKDAAKTTLSNSGAVTKQKSIPESSTYTNVKLTDRKEDLFLGKKADVNMKSLLKTAAAQSVIQNGYNIDQVLQSIKIFLKNSGRTDFSSTDLMKILLDLEDGLIQFEDICNDLSETFEEMSLQDTPSGNIDKSEEREERQVEAKVLLEENRQLKEQTLCKICLEDNVSIVFLPCGHLCCCSQCAPALWKCPICRVFIKGTVKTYLN